MGWNHQRNRIFFQDFDGISTVAIWTVGHWPSFGVFHPKRPCARSVPSLVPMPCRMLSAEGRFRLKAQVATTNYLVGHWWFHICWRNSVACLRWWSNMTTEHLWDGLKPPTVYSLICRVVLSVWMHALRSLRARQSQESFAVESIQLFGQYTNHFGAM